MPAASKFARSHAIRGKRWRIDSRTCNSFKATSRMSIPCSGVDRAFLLTNSTERTEHQQIAFTRVAQQSGVRHIVKLSQLHADRNSPGRFLRYHAGVEAAGLTFTFLRPNLYMQRLLNFRQSIQGDSLMPQGGKLIITKTLRNPQNFSYEVSHLRVHATAADRPTGWIKINDLWDPSNCGVQRLSLIMYG